MGRIVFIGMSLFVVVSMILILGIKLINGDITLILPLIFFLGFLIYDLSFIIEEIRKVKKDREMGLIREVLQLCEFKIIGKSLGDHIPPTPTAIFKSKTKEFIALTGDYSKVRMRIGRKYEVCYYKESRVMVSIKELFREVVRRSSYEI